MEKFKKWMEKKPGFTTFQDFVDFSNDNKIPLLLGTIPAQGQINIAYFKRDEQFIKEALNDQVSVNIYIEYFPVPDRIGNTQQELIEYKDKELTNDN